MVSSIFNICSCFLYFTELTWLQNKIENNPLHCCLDWYWCILLGYTRCCDVFFMVSNARGTGTWSNVKFPPTRDLIRVKCPGVARGGWAFLDLTHTLQGHECRCPRDFAPRDIAPLRGQISRDLALPAHPPLGISPPRPNDTFQRIFLYLDLATKKASEIWFGNLFDNGFARVRLRANVVWYF